MELWNDSFDKQLCKLDFKTLRLIIADHWISVKYFLCPYEYSKEKAICEYHFLADIFTFKSTQGKKDSSYTPNK